MNKKKLIAVILAAIAFALVIGVLYIQFGYERLEKTVSLQGYEITVPQRWSSDSKGILYDKNGNTAGNFTLVNEDKVMVGKEIDKNTIKCETKQDNKKAVVYYIKNLPNPEPFAVSLLFYKDIVSDRLSQKIYESFKIPAIGTNPPRKNLVFPELSEIKDDKICRVELADGTVTVKNIKHLDIFADRKRDKQSMGVNVLDYKEENGTFLLNAWYYLESDKGTGYVYTYYKKEDGRYTYSNNPLTFDAVTKEMSEKKGTTSYRLTSAGVNTMTVLEIPLNLYRDNAEELISLKTLSATEIEIQKILDTIKTKEELNSLTFKISDSELLVTYDENIKPERNKAYQDAAVFFSLAANLKNVSFGYSDGTKYTYTREKMQKSLEININSAANSKEDFIDYTEEIGKNEHSQVADGESVVNFIKS